MSRKTTKTNHPTKAGFFIKLLRNLPKVFIHFSMCIALSKNCPAVVSFQFLVLLLLKISKQQRPCDIYSKKKAREFYRIIRLHDQEVRSNGLFAYTSSSFYSTKVAVKSSTTIVEINELNVIFTKSKLFLLKANYYVDYYFIMRKNLCITEMIERFVGTTRNGSCLFSLCTPFYTACTVGNHDPFWQHTP